MKERDTQISKYPFSVNLPMAWEMSAVILAGCLSGIF